ncbi:hypothetical protein [Bacillus toyonensis]|nr:hypothetical protein [Bacillus toyonensis]MED2615466.1 hypothetical protein [Bacillus toyonensis]
MKKLIIGVFVYLPLAFWLSYFCGISTVEVLATTELPAESIT